MYLKINPFVTVLGQDRKVIDQHFYLIYFCFNTKSITCNYLFHLNDCTYTEAHDLEGVHSGSELEVF